MSCRLACAVAALSVVLAGFGAAAAPGDPGWLPDFRPDDWHASWIWHRPVQGPCHRYFRRSFRLDDPGSVTRAIFQWASDDGAEVLVNGTSLGRVTSWSHPMVNETVKPLLTTGENTIFVDAWNAASSAAFLGELDLVRTDGSVEKIGSGSGWEASEKREGPWSPAHEVMRVPQPPYGETPYVDCTGKRRMQPVPEPASPEEIAAPALTTEIRRGRGGARYFENGVERPFISYRTPSACPDPLRSLRYMAGADSAGVRLAELDLPLRTLWRSDGSLDFVWLERFLGVALRHGPHMNLVVFFGIDAPDWYVNAHPGERFVNEEGPIGRMSFASETWRADTCDVLRRLVEHLRGSPFWNRIAGFGLDGGFDGQFMQWTVRGKAGDALLGDESEPMKRLFGRSIPAAARRRGGKDSLILDPVADADVIAWNRVFGRTAADFLLACAGAIKTASERTKVVMAYYGKFFSIAGYNEWGELAIDRVLASGDVDALVAVEYKQRPGGLPHSLSAPTESYAAHGRLFVDEADIRTFLDGQKNWAYAGDAKGTESMMRKMFACSFVRGHGMHWYDLFGGWYDHPLILKTMSDIQRIAETHATRQVRPAEIAVVCDEESMRHATCAIKGETARTMLHFQNGVLGRIGAPFDLWFADDLASAPKYKLYIFLDCFAPRSDAAAAIARIKSSGVTCIAVNLGDRVPTPSEYRTAARAAGVFIVSDSDDVMIYAGRGLLGAHAASGGVRTLHWPEAVTFRDAVTGATVAADAETIRLEFVAGETKLLSVDPKACERGMKND